jgi:hypothetical protein
MYNWFNKHLDLKQPTPVVEKPFVPIAPKDLSVFDAQHLRPKDAVEINGLRRYLTAKQDGQLAALLPKDAKGLAEFRRVEGVALRTMMADQLPAADAAVIDAENVRVWKHTSAEQPGGAEYRLARKGTGESVPAEWLTSEGWDGTVVIWIHPDGRASLRQNQKLVPAAKEIISKHAVLLAPDVFMTGDFKAGKRVPLDKQPNAGFAGYNWGYNRTLLADRVHDILTTVAFARQQNGVKKVVLVGFGEAGPWVVLARGLCGDAVARTAADLNGFRFEQILSMNDEMMQPGALRYGGLPALAALCAPHELYLHNTKGAGSDRWVASAYRIEGQSERLRREEARSSAENVITWLLR